MNDHTTDFGDILTSMIAQKKNTEAEEQRLRAEAAAADHALWKEAMRPLLTVMRQVKERYPRADIFNISNHSYSRDPHLYVDSSTRIIATYDTKTKVFKIEQRYISWSNHKFTELLQSENPEDLIPMLLEKLVICVTR